MIHRAARRPVLMLAALLATGAARLALSGEEARNAARLPGVVLTGPRNASGSAGRPHAANDGDVADYGPSHGYAWAFLETPLLLTFPQAAAINKVELLLLDVDSRTYDFRVEVSADGQDFRPVGERKGAAGWQAFTFPTAEYRTVRVLFTGTSVPTRSYHVVEIAAWNQPDPDAPSPLRAAFEEQRRRRGPDAVARLGLQPLVDAVFGNAEVRERLRAAPEKQILELRAEEAPPGPPNIGGERASALPIPPNIGGDRGGRAQRIAAWREGNMLVAVLDEDGDMRPGAYEPDTDSDCWAADYGGDGTIDRVVDYIDQDGDGDGDAMVLYLFPPNTWSKRSMTCVVIGDVGDDNRMWQLVRYEYVQPTCQWICDFNGDEYFSIGLRDDRTGRWVSTWENPFCFYDPDRDGAAEIAVRFSGTDLRLRSLRYSFDADNDAGPDNPHDYDFSITALGNVEVPPEAAEEFPLRDGEKLRSTAWKDARRVAETGAWKRALLAWDEMDNNVNQASRVERTHERWEGVIAPGSSHFPQEGGPPISALNTRCEVDNDFSGKMGLYLSGIDHRLHLRGAEFGWLDADWNHDGRVDMRFRYEDSDGNGFFDTWKTDADGDGVFERVVRVADERATPVPLEYEAIVKAYASALGAARASHERMMAALGPALAGWQPPVERYWASELATGFYAGAKIRASAEGRRLYADLSRETAFARVRSRVEPPHTPPKLGGQGGVATTTPPKLGGQGGAASALDIAYTQGDAPAVSRILAGAPEAKASAVSVSLQLHNPLPVRREGEAVVVSLAEWPELRRSLRGERLAAVRGALSPPSPPRDRGGKGGLEPAQVDDLDGDGEPDEVVFLADLPAGGSRRVRLEAPAPPDLEPAPRTAANPEMGESIGWESERVAYRSYYGKIDFFGKKQPLLKLSELRGAYHRDSAWGMDALHIGPAAGIGGLYLAAGDALHPAMNEAGRPDNVTVSRRVVASGPLRSTVEVTLSGLKGPQGSYTLTRRFSIAAGDLHTTETLTVTGGTALVHLSAGLMKIPGARLDQQIAPPFGCVSLWGEQEHPDVAEAGEIGLALLFPTESLLKIGADKHDHLVYLRARPGEPQTLYLAADWAKGGRYRTAEEWHAGMAALSQRLASPIGVGLVR